MPAKNTPVQIIIVGIQPSRVEHATATAYATLMLFVWPFGIPAVYLYTFWLHRGLLMRSRRAEMRSSALWLPRALSLTRYS